MRYIRIDPSYLIEDSKNIIPLKKKEFINGEQLPKFARKDLVILIGQDFEALSENREEVESGQKKYLDLFYKIFVADTDLNAIDYIQQRKVHRVSDYQPLMRAFEIDEMVELLKEDNPVDFLDDEHKKNDDVIRAVLMFVNFETRERKIIDIIFSKERVNLNAFLDECKKDGYVLLFSLNTNEIFFFENEINKMLEMSGEINHMNIAYNKRNDFSLDKDISVDSLTERELMEIFNPLELFQQDLKTVKSRREDRGEVYYFTLLDFLRNKLLDEVGAYSEILQDAVFEDNIYTLDYYTAGRLDVDDLLSIRDLVEKRENAILDFVNNAKELLDEIENLLEYKPSVSDL